MSGGAGGGGGEGRGRERSRRSMVFLICITLVSLSPPPFFFSAVLPPVKPQKSPVLSVLSGSLGILINYN